MSIDILKFIDKHIAEYEHIESAAQALRSLFDALTKEMDQDYLGDLYRTDYMVTGYGAFPVDMLRYTCSWPKDETDVREIEKSIGDEVADVDKEQFTIRLTKYHRDPKPTLAEDRWKSKFRWKVIGEPETTKQ